MDKWQTLQSFWESFDIPAYDEQTTFTDGAEPSFPHITYEGTTGVFEQVLTLSASLWYKSSSWAEISQKADEIVRYITTHAPLTISTNGGYFWVKTPFGVPFSQRMDSGNDKIKRIVINIEAEYLTSY